MIIIYEIKSDGDGQMEVIFRAWATSNGKIYESFFEFKGNYFCDYNSDKKEIEENLRQLIKENI